MPEYRDAESLQYDPDDMPDADAEPTNELPDTAPEADTTAHPEGKEFETPSQADRASDEDAQKQADEPYDTQINPEAGRARTTQAAPATRSTRSRS